VKKRLILGIASTAVLAGLLIPLGTGAFADQNTPNKVTPAQCMTNWHNVITKKWNSTTNHEGFTSLSQFFTKYDPVVASGNCASGSKVNSQINTGLSGPPTTSPPALPTSASIGSSGKA
jgi:hypothetical protein